MDVVAIGAALGLAFVLGISSAPNAASALIASRAAAWRVALGYSFVLHAVGALLGGTAVALTIAGLVSVPADEVATVYASGCIAAIAFGAVAARLGLPTSATHGLVGGLIGAGLASGGIHAINWGGLDGFRAVGALGVLLALVLSPILGVGEDGSRGGSRCEPSPVHPAPSRAGARRHLGGRGRRRPERRDERRSEGDGCGGGGLARDRKDRPVRGAATGAGTRRVRVRARNRDRRRPPHPARGSRVLPADARRLARLETAAAAVILGSSAVGAPVSTTTVVTAAVVGVGADRHPRHVRWAGVADTISAWS